MRSAILQLSTLASVALGLALLLPAAPALAQTNGSQSGSDFPDLVPVAVWTAVAVVLTLLLTSVAYLYRRERGLDEPRPNVPIPFKGDGSDAAEPAEMAHGAHH